MPLNSALKNTFFLPIASSSPSGQTAKIAQIRTMTSNRITNDQIGWRSMKPLTRLPIPLSLRRWSACIIERSVSPTAMGPERAIPALPIRLDASSGDAHISQSFLLAIDRQIAQLAAR
jgi:hypothetical protein